MLPTQRWFPGKGAIAEGRRHRRCDPDRGCVARDRAVISAGCGGPVTLHGPARVPLRRPGGCRAPRSAGGGARRARDQRPRGRHDGSVRRRVQRAGVRRARCSTPSPGGAGSRPTNGASRRLDRRRASRRCAARQPTFSPPTLLGGEQSNSSLRFDDRLMLKVFRRVAEGIESRARDRPLPDRGGGLPAHRAARRGARVPAAARRAGDAWPSSRASSRTKATPGATRIDQVEHYLEEALLRREAGGAGLAAASGLRPDRPGSARDRPRARRRLPRGGALARDARGGAPPGARASRPRTPISRPSRWACSTSARVYQSLRNLVGQVFRTLRERQRSLPEQIAGRRRPAPAAPRPASSRDVAGSSAAG